MLLSRKHNFIFIHIYKNAGSSITSALFPFAAGEHQLKANEYLKKININYFEPQPFHIHIKASALAEKIGRKAFNKFFTFAIVRNPWDWQVSLYTFMLRYKEHHQHELVKSFRDFNEYIRWRCAEEVRFQKDFIVDEDGKIMIDFVGRFENLNADFKQICSRIGISVDLPKINVSNEMPYQSFYDEESIALVREAFKPDIELFNYNFEPLP